ncbi:anthrax toxin lethal factor [Bacillus anthracis]|uniref:Lethal factor n=7 Tax=Bacillus anthracis TaxID=1392 RepID=LEF_BACAN|nr:anthrax toxin lethal factor [Bacillus anthracis]P15917.2 RecName: Full=Lethal factor; Short=LF; AltName: Full=Anthrax lethal toxin endopeptidase component; Flags: Precursor [Bacillus anthracis]6PSN_L Chain L, Lethal factor [Bacillus anthracis]6ZXJ_H Chain H, Lethal factor [Bacillus anthracis]6ZXJ_I Chain I, Lethal factor [Bacillus anthracis]6ZXK_H Chain H, Lethal factor [Bacillus anthracis]6ZXK_I Chain I, Lethal factor [Bacillus anthracis]6ZXK_J Chain J, Lethal factor [Bacillus anthracis]
MNIKKEFIKVISMSCLVTAITLSGPVFIPLVQGAGGHGDVGMHVKEKEKNKDENKRKDEERNKTQEEHLKEIMKHIVKIEVKGEEAVKKEAAEKLLEKVPSDVLEMYKAIGGKIYIVDGDITKHISLEALSEDKKKIKDIYGKDALLHEHYVYAKEGYEPVLVIQSSEDYVENTEKALNVYYEIGKILSRDILSKINQPYQKFLDVLNTIKNASDSDGQDLLFTNQLKEHPTDFSVEFLEQNSNEVQEVFAKAFAYYIEPQHRDVLQLYAPEAFNYMDKFNEQEINLSLEELKDQRMLARYEKWEKIKQHYQHWSDSLSEEGRGLLKKLQIPIEPKKDDIIHSLSQEEKELLKRIQIDSSDFLSTEEKEFLKKLQIDIRDSLSEEEKELLNRIQVDSSNPLSEKEKEFLKKLKLDIQPYDINQRLQDTGGLIDSPSINLDVRKQYKRDIQNIDALLHQSIGSTLYNKIYLYENMNINNLTATLGADLVDSTDNTKINRGIFNEFKKNFKYSISSNYMIVDINERPALDNERLKWRIQLSPDTRAGYLENGKLILQRNIGLEIKDVQIIKQSEKEYIRIDAKVVPKSKIDTKIQEAQLNINQEWNKALGLPKYTKLITFNVHNRYASNIVESAYLILNEWKNNIQSDLIKKVTNYLVDGNGRFVFTDITLPNIAEQYTHQDEIYEQVHSKGLYVPESRSILLHGPSKGVELRNDSEGFIHEFGHAVDDYAGYLLDKNQSDLVTNSKKFIDIFKEEGSNLTSYGRTNEAEFFAEAFRLMHSTDHAERLKVQKNAPKTFQFINDQIKFIINS